MLDQESDKIAHCGGLQVGRQVFFETAIKLIDDTLYLLSTKENLCKEEEETYTIRIPYLMWAIVPP